MWTFDNYDELAKWIVRTTYDIAQKNNHNPVDVPHLFFVLINQSNNTILQLLKQWWADLNSIKTMTQSALAWLLSIQDQFSISPALNEIFVNANKISKSIWSSDTDIYSIFLSLLQSSNYFSKQLNQQWITFEKIKSIISQMPKSKLESNENITTQNNPDSESDVLNKYSEDLIQLAKDWKLKEVIWREKDLNKLMEILCRKEKNNVVILWDSWVGKTAVAELLAQKINSWEVPEFFKDKKILRINLWSLIAGSKFRWDFEDRISSIIKTVKASNWKIILFIDEFHNVAWAGKAEWSMDMSEMLKPELSSWNIQIIWATTTSEYRLNIEKDTALTRRFETITIQEPSVQDTITILRWIESSFEKHHWVTIFDTALIAAVELSDRYIKDRKLPDKAINVLDQAATKVKIAMTSLPQNISEIQIKIWQLNKEKASITQELSDTKDTFTISESQKKLQNIDQEITKLQSSYDTSKAIREKIKKLFEENKTLYLQVQELDNKAKDFEKKSELEQVSKIKYWDIVEIQNKIKSNKDEISLLQSQSWIIIKDTVEREDIAKVISEKTWIPLTKMVEEESQKLAKLEEYLSTKVIGQDEAIIAISNAIRRARIWLKDPKKPIWSFIFLGPTGVWKTELAKALAEFLFFDKKAMVRLNMSEYKEEHSTSKLIWSPPWYIGYEQWWQLTEAIRRKPYSVILLDEVEKAHQSVFDLFLQVFDDGMLNDSLGNTVDFKNTIIIMTSNIWSREIMEKLQWSSVSIWDLYPVDVPNPEKIISQQENIINPENIQATHKRNRRWKKKINPDSTSDKSETNKALDDQISKIEELREELDPILMDFFRPEFLNRLDWNIIFNPISPEMLKNILEIKLKEQFDLIYASNKITLTISNQAKNFLAKKWRDPANWARPINRALQNYIIDPLAKEIVWWKFTQWDTINIDCENNKLTFQK